MSAALSLTPPESDIPRPLTTTPPGSDPTPPNPDPVDQLSNDEWNEPIYIPEPSRNFPLNTFHWSVRTLHFLNTNNFWLAGDLHDWSFFKIRMLRWCDHATMCEVLQLVRSMQQADAPTLAIIQNRREARRLAALPIPPEVVQPKKRSKRRKIQPFPVFLVPEFFRALNPFELPISVRLATVLATRDVKCLGDLNNQPVSYLKMIKGCGTRSIIEMQLLIGQTATGGIFPQPPAIFSVPEPIRNQPPRDLPLSVRLANSLTALNVHTLGELHGRPEADLLLVKNCGPKTVAELRSLFQRAAAGEFSPPPDAADSGPVELVQLLDKLLASLPERDLKVLCLRLGGEPGEKMTLDAVGQVVQLTRERIRQIVKTCLRQLRQAGSHRLRWHLEEMIDRGREAGLPPLAELLEENLPPGTGRFRPAFYIRLIDKLQHAKPQSGEIE